MKISVKRIYDEAASSDGVRALVDRLWPRGVSKEEAEIDAWIKDIAPSSALRTWFHKDPEKRYEDFSVKYHAELAQNQAACQELVEGKKHLTLVTSVRDIAHSHIPTLVSFLEGL